ncbi:hypothetical protein ABT144_21720 [Streptomyces sp. NPDC002039]|uniref:hypothetical protein n=1 Tax=Streptomyces sp. NPDC002039 TaxID=3154660 RepID=UPI0033305158
MMPVGPGCFSEPDEEVGRALPRVLVPMAAASLEVLPDHFGEPPPDGVGKDALAGAKRRWRGWAA